MASPLSDVALDQLFRTARTVNGWQDKVVSDEQIKQLYELFKWGPTSANSCPARFVWVRSEQGKKTLADLAKGGNPEKILAAPVIAIIGNNMAFPHDLDKLVPASRLEGVKKMFSNPDVIQSTAMRNGTLQGAYLILAARALGLDCGPMSGFDNDGVDQAFFAGTDIKSNFICCLGYGKADSAYPRASRLSFDQAGSFA